LGATLVFPAVRPAAAIRAARRRVIVVDDDEFLRELLYIHLSNDGYDVVIAEDAVAAGRAVLERVPDLMISDVDMPHMDGIELVSAIRADRSIPFFPVIFLSAMPQEARRARGLGATYLLKPILADRLLDAVAAELQFRAF